MIIEKHSIREEWLAARKTGIGGSEASALLGRNPYMNNETLYQIKVGEKQAIDISNVDCVRYGTEAEPFLRELFKLDFPKYQVEHEEFTIYRNETHPFIFGSFDGILTDRETGEKGILEIKTTEILSSMHREKWNDKIPDNYFIQVLHYLLVSGFSFAILKAQLKTNYQGEIRTTNRHYFLKRESHIDDIELIKQKEINFWNNNVLPRVKPSLLLPAI